MTFLEDTFRFFSFFGKSEQNGPPGWPSVSTYDYIVLHWVEIGKRYKLSIVCVDVLFQMNINLWGRFLAITAPEAKICRERIDRSNSRFSYVGFCLI